jgi:hypothetical protein
MVRELTPAAELLHLYTDLGKHSGVDPGHDVTYVTSVILKYCVGIAFVLSVLLQH